MTFEVLPVLSAMEALYQKPITIERFKTYLRMLQGGVKGGSNFLLEVLTQWQNLIYYKK
ncbi:hypothetical protein [Aquimarina hainanensis]|uniref:hypothetical protein n=1 Tax=Aquimarina hainanensis TaxID=1578017 RepID=UPI003613FE1F